MSGRRYITLRGSVYTYRRRVPEDLAPFVGKRIWKISLGTRQLREAEQAADEIAAQHNEIIRMARGRSPRDRLDEVLTRGRELQLKIAQAIGRYHAEYIGTGRASRNPEVVKWQQEIGSLRKPTLDLLKEVKADMIESGLTHLSMASGETVRSVGAAGGVEGLIDEAMSRRASFQSAADDLEFVQRGILPVYEGRLETAEIDFERHKRRLRDTTQTLAKLRLDDPAAPEDSANPRIKTASELWFEKRKQGIAAVRRHRVAVRRFVELHGNIPVRHITRQMVESYVDAIGALADHRRLPAAQRGGLSDPGADVPRVSAPTVERHIISIKALLKFAMEKGWVVANVATGIKAPEDTRPKANVRRSFSREERLQLVSRAIGDFGEDGDITWLIRILAYTGARLEEIAQLARENVRQIDGVWAIEIDDLGGRNLKTRDSVRVLPLHPAIRDEFIAWVDAGKGPRVFASFKRNRDGRYSPILSGVIARLMDRAGLKDTRLVGHSWRHTLKREMSNARVDSDLRRIILGHAPRDRHDGYVGHSLGAAAEEFARMPALF